MVGAVWASIEVPMGWAVGVNKYLCGADHGAPGCFPCGEVGFLVFSQIDV